MSEKLLASLLVAHPGLSRDEPEVAANIAIQLEHMGLEVRGISLLRRIRDVVAKLEAKTVLEVGAGIGHLSAWLFDYFAGADNLPERYTIVEEGSRFAVIIKRLLNSSSAGDWAEVIVGNPVILAAETKAWSLSGTTADKPILSGECDCIIVDTGIGKIVETITALLPLLKKGGLLLATEPTAPTGEKDVNDSEVKSFNAWMELIKICNESHKLAFMPIYGGTLVAFLND
jgi:predicted O-methyltransferase YrrM